MKKIINILFIIVIILNFPFYNHIFKVNPNRKVDPPIKNINIIKNWFFKFKHNKLNIPLNKKVCKSNLLLIKKIFDKNNIKFYLSDGTALGAFRDNDFISYDDDVDICTLEHQSRIEKIIPELLNNGFKIGRIKNRGSKFYSLIRNGEYVDIDIIVKNKMCATCDYDPNCNNIIPFLLNHSKIKFQGEIFNIPNVKYFEYVYGSDWKIPQKKKPIH